MPIFQLSNELVFPPPELAEPDGLLAVGGDLSPERLLLAYRMGIFPWFSEGDPILWWCPTPRLVILPAEFRVPSRLARQLRQNRFRVTADRAFIKVIHSCAVAGDRHKRGTWLTSTMIEVYTTLHTMGYAHSVECWQEDRLAGGLYGLALGGVFFGESMFSVEPGSSKTALVTLVTLLKGWNFDLIDCQLPNRHFNQFGARELTGADFQNRLRQSLKRTNRIDNWDRSIQNPPDQDCEIPV